ncbi:MAG: type II secretion system protein E [Parcubacteria group bacterium GW2011_GWA2_37_10]|nr:MAG: type II secretion system protein E [Parcubacteria group bacterium GW2011_GWA2_37_10]
MKIDSGQLKTFFLDARLVTTKQFEDSLKKSQETNQKIGDILVAGGFITEEQLKSAEAYLLGVPFMNIENENIPPEILKIIPESIARANHIIAFKKDGNNLEVAMLDPDDIRTIEFIKKASPSLKILPRLTTPEGIKSALHQYQKTLEIEFGDIIKNEAKTIKVISKRGESAEESEELKKVAQEIPVIRIVDSLMKHAILQRASDVHIEPSEEGVVVRYRVDGILKDVMMLPISATAGVVARIKVLSNLKLDEHRLPQDGRFKIESQEFKYSVRVSVLPVLNGEKVVMRLLAEGEKTHSLEGLGLAGKYLEKVRDNLMRPSGMILITGPTGSGKTTTLYGMMEILNTPDVNISTVEDPIEYRMPRINQTQINQKIGLTFVSGLRSLVRQDPDIIMVGEIRDKETASLAINAALTGHLVLSTLHTTEAAGAIPRLIDMGCEPFLISSTLNLVIAQRLVRKFYGPKERYKLKPAELKNIEKYCDLKRILEILRQEKLVSKKTDLGNVDFYRPKPSKDNPEGYQGRIGIFEVLPVTDPIKDLIVKRATTKEIASQAIKEGMITMIEDGFLKVVQGLTSLEEVLRVITE